MRIYLLGFMGSGKSHWGKQLALINNINFYDLDNEVEISAGKSIAAIFDQHGETEFRKRENAALHSIDDANAIIATGGGTPCFFDNMDWMNNNGLTVFIDASPSFIMNNLENEREKRPLLKNLDDEGLESFIRSKMKERNFFYKQAAMRLDADSMSIGTLQEVLKKYK